MTVGVKRGKCELRRVRFPNNQVGVWGSTRPRAVFSNRALVARSRVEPIPPTRADICRCSCQRVALVLG